MSFDLPVGWAWAQLGDIVGVRGEKLRPDTSNGLPFIGMDDVLPGSLKVTSHGWFREMRSTANAVYPGDILYGRLRPYLNKVAMGEIAAAASAEFIVLTARPGIDARYVQLALHAEQFVNFATRDTAGDRPRIDFDKISKFEIPIPPSAEQRRIVARIDELSAEIDEGEAALNRARQGLDTWRRALLKAAVTGELTRDWRESNRPIETGADLLTRIRAQRDLDQSALRLSGARSSVARESSSQFEVPESWTWATIGDVASAVDYGTSEKCGTDPIGVPVLRMGNIQEGEVNITHLKYLDGRHARNLALLEEGDILFNRTNSAELVGKTAIYRGQPRPCSFASYLVRLRVILCDPEYIVYWLNSAFGKKWVSENKSQQVGQANLSGGKLKRMLFPLPPLVEQKEIVRRLRQQLDAGDIGYSTVGQIDHDRAALRQAILKAAFEGSLVAQDPADEPASTLLARLRCANAGSATPPRRARVRTPFSHPSWRA